MNLKECGSADLDYRSTRTRPTSLRTSDRASLLRYMGLRKLPWLRIRVRADPHSTTPVRQRLILPTLPTTPAGGLITRPILVNRYNQPNRHSAAGLRIRCFGQRELSFPRTLKELAYGRLRMFLSISRIRKLRGWSV
jgi:hypothetical protein